jgi:hypothetical protein
MKGFAVVQVLVLTMALFTSAFVPFAAHAKQNTNDDQSQQEHHDNDHGDNNGHNDGDHNGDDHGDNGNGHNDGDHDDDDDQTPPPPPAPTTITISATKIVCDNETSLPNWGLGGAPITATTAADFLLAHLGCHLQSGWSFEYGDQNTTDAGDTLIGPAGNGYTTFGPTDVNGVASVTVPVAGVTEFHVREVLQSGYVPFTYATTNSNISAEFYCANDVMNYDNYDFIRTPVAGSTYHCVAFNTPVVVPPPPAAACADGTDNDEDGLTDQADPGCHSDGNAGNSESYVAGDTDETNVIVPPPPAAACADGTDNDTDGLIDQADPGCHSDGNAGNSESYVASDTDETNAPTDNTSGGGNGGSGGGSGEPTQQTQPTGENGPVGGNGPIAGSFGGSGGGSVLGASTTSLPELPKTCTALLHTYMRMGRKNDTDEVKKLQQFLNEHMDSHLTVNGFFGKDTDTAVRAFQKKYQPQVLTPWGIQDSTGYVFKTTQRWINMLNCSSLNIPMPQL